MARHFAGVGLNGVEDACVAFDGSEFEFAYRAHAARLRAVAYHVLGDRDAAEDAVHAALLRVWRRGGYRAERGALLPFLIACVRRESLDQLRGARRRSERERRSAAPSVVPDPTQAIDPVETRRVGTALAHLTDAQREVIVQAYYGARTLAEIARAADVPLGTIKSRLAQALRRLHGELSEGMRS